MRTHLASLSLVLLLAGAATAADYDLVLSGGRVMDPGSGLDAVRDIVVRDGELVDGAMPGRALRAQAR